MMNMDPRNLESKSRDELAAMARDMGLSHTDMNKDQLMQTIRDHSKGM